MLCSRALVTSVCHLSFLFFLFAELEYSFFQLAMNLFTLVHTCQIEQQTADNDFCSEVCQEHRRATLTHHLEQARTLAHIHTEHKEKHTPGARTHNCCSVANTPAFFGCEMRVACVIPNLMNLSLCVCVCGSRGFSILFCSHSRKVPMCGVPLVRSDIIHSQMRTWLVY